MAKHIKALKCPQCGSIKKQELKEDHYICNNCGTEYFLDDDDINVNVRHDHTYPGQRPGSSGNRKVLLIVAVVIAVIFIFIPALLGILTKGSNSRSFSGSKAKNYRERIVDFFAVDAVDGKTPVLVFNVERSYTGRERREDEHFMRFYDPIKEKVLKEIPMPDWNDDSNIFRYRTFSDGFLYFSPDNIPKIYRINSRKKDVEDVTDIFLGEVPELSSGIATIDLVFKRYGDGFKIMTNNGKEYYYYPLSKQLYTGDKEKDKAAEDKESLLPRAVEDVYFTFTDESFDYRDEKTQLIKFWYRYNKGYPTALPLNPEWRKAYRFPQQSGIYSGSFSHEKNLFSDSRVSRFKDLTPDRLYFEPEIAYADSTDLYITGLPNANPDGNPFLQKIDTKTGEVLWSFTPSYTKYQFHRDFFKYNGGIVLNCFNYGSPGRIDFIILLDKEGKIVKEIDRDKLF